MLWSALDFSSDACVHMAKLGNFHLEGLVTPVLVGYIVTRYTNRAAGVAAGVFYWGAQMGGAPSITQFF